LEKSDLGEVTNYASNLKKENATLNRHLN